MNEPNAGLGIALRRVGGIVLALAVVAACSSGLGDNPTTPPEAETATSAPVTPKPTKTPWPAKWAEHMCAAAEIFSGVSDQLSDLQEAAEELNLPAISVGAYSTRSALQDAKAELKAAGSWKPGKDLKEKMLAATNTFIKSLRDIEKGVDELDTDLLTRGGKRMVTGSKQLNKATKALLALNDKTGFNCD